MQHGKPAERSQQPGSNFAIISLVVGQFCTGSFSTDPAGFACQLAVLHRKRMMNRYPAPEWSKFIGRQSLRV